MLKWESGRSPDRDTSTCVALHLFAIAFVLAVLAQSCSLDHGLEPSGQGGNGGGHSVQGIRGTVHFHGVWPESIVEVRVAVFADYPVVSFFDLSGYSDPVPLASDSAAYDIELAPGSYDFVAVAGRTDSWLTASVLGFYHTEADPEIPRAVHIESGEYVDGIDITVDFMETGPFAQGGTGGHWSRGKGPAHGVVQDE